jgi:hypothetical protein
LQQEQQQRSPEKKSQILLEDKPQFVLALGQRTMIGRDDLISV